MAFLGHQFDVVADLDDTAAIKNDQPVGIAKGGQAVGDGDGGTTAYEVVEGLLDFFLGGGVDR